MREILFRGRLKHDNGLYKKGQWVYGDLVRMVDGGKVLPHIYGTGEVVEESIGQFTGIYDATLWEELTKKEQADFLMLGNKKADWKGKEIFEGDIIKCNNYHGNIEGKVQFYKGTYYLACTSGYSDEYLFNCNNIEVIGNIYDNADLLGEV